MIQLRNVKISYHRKVAITDVNLDIPKCSITTLFGPSGCGKSSLLFSINRLTDHLPNCKVEGEIRVDGKDISQLTQNLPTLRHKVGIVFQKSNLFPLSIKKNIFIPLFDRGWRRKNDQEEKMIRVLQEVGLWEEVKDRLNESAHSLSGGQQQRLALARTLALDPQVILLDEPCSSLDPHATLVIEDLLLNLRSRLTLLLVTHDMAQARRISSLTAVFTMNRGIGVLTGFGPPQQVLEKAKNPDYCHTWNGLTRISAEPCH